MYFIGCIFLCVLGLCAIISPDFIYEMKQQWKNSSMAKASGAYKVYVRMVGSLLLIIGLGCMIALCFADQKQDDVPDLYSVTELHSVTEYKRMHTDLQRKMLLRSANPAHSLAENRQIFLLMSIKDLEKSEHEKPYYGDWVIKEQTGYGYQFSVTYKEEDYKGVKIHISKDKFTVGKTKWSKGIEVVSPVYEESEVTDDDLVHESRIHKRNLGYRDDEQMTGVNILDGKKEIDAFGTSFYVKDNDHLIFCGPMYFMAERMEK